jgi:ligand-binding sensor domain-containing protein
VLPRPPGERGQGYFGHADEGGQWWVARNDFVGRLEKGVWISGLSVSNVARETVASAPARDGSNLVLLGRELIRLRGGIETGRIVLPESPGSVWSMMEDRRTNVWIATHSSGISRVTPTGEMRRWGTTNGLSTLSTRFVFEDREENLWIGTSGGGLMRFKPRRARTIGPENGLSERVVRSVAPDSSGGVWIATYGQGLFRWKDDRLSRFTDAEGRHSGSYAQSVYEDRAGRIWLGLFQGGVNVFDSQGVRLFPTGRVGGGNVISIFDDSRGRGHLRDRTPVSGHRSDTQRVHLAT